MSMIRPMYGRGMGKRFKPRNPTPDLFGGVADEEENSQFAMRCKGIISFLNGERSDPALTHLELTYGELLGGDELDRSVEASGIRRGLA